jgi:hypothetical protein
MATPKNWTVSEITKHLEIDVSEYEALVVTFSGILRDSNLYCQKLNTKESKVQLQNCIDSNLDKLPCYVRNKPAELRYKIMKGLAQRINFNKSRNTAGQQSENHPVKSSRRESAEECSPPKAGRLPEGLQFRALSVENTVYPLKTSLCLVDDVLFEHPDEPMIHKKLNFEKWINIVKKDCGYVEKKHILQYKCGGRALTIDNDRSWRAAVTLMQNHGDEVMTFEMGNRDGGKQDYSDL